MYVTAFRDNLRILGVFNFCSKTMSITGKLQQTGNAGFYFCYISVRNISFTKNL